MDDRHVLIDLDVEREQPASESAKPPPGVAARRWSIGAAALAGVLVLGAGGGAPIPPPPLRQVHVAPIDPADLYHLIDDLLVTATPVTTADQPERRFTGLDLTNGRRLWSWVTMADRPDAGAPMAVGTFVADGTLLITTEPGGDTGLRTTAVDPRTGEHRWSVPYWLRTVPGERFAFIFDQIFRPESRITHRPVGPEQLIYLAADGSSYTEPPIGLIVRAVDLDTGQVRWETPRLTDADAVVVPAGGGQPTVLLTVADDGEVEVRDAATGAPRHRLDWPGGKPVTAERVGDVVVVSRTGSDPAAVVYPATLQRPLWSRSLSGPNPILTSCGPVLCWPDADTGTVAFDPATGEILWRLSEQAQFLAAGSRLVQLDSGWRFQRVIDPWTGRALGDLTGWRLADQRVMADQGQLRADVPPLVLRLNAAAQQTELGVLEPAEASVRSLGVVPYVLSECSVERRFLACTTTDGQLRVWRYEVSRARHR